MSGPMTPNKSDSGERKLPPLKVIDAIDKWVHSQTRFHLSDTDGYEQMLTEVSEALTTHIQTIGEVMSHEVNEGELRKKIVSELLQYRSELSQGLNQLASGKTATELSTDNLMQLLTSHSEAYAAEEVKEARVDEVAMFARMFIKETNVGSTPSDLIESEPYIEAEGDEIIAYVDERLAQLTNNKTPHKEK